MCDVCKAEGLNTKFKNGEKSSIYKESLYKVFKSSVADIRLCHFHSVELFQIGESRFLQDHLNFARRLATRAIRREEPSYFGF